MYINHALAFIRRARARPAHLKSLKRVSKSLNRLVHHVVAGVPLSYFTYSVQSGQKTEGESLSMPLYSHR